MCLKRNIWPVFTVSVQKLFFRSVLCKQMLQKLDPFQNNIKFLQDINSSPWAKLRRGSCWHGFSRFQALLAPKM